MANIDVHKSAEERSPLARQEGWGMTPTLTLLALLLPLSCQATTPVAAPARQSPAAPESEAPAACADRLKAFTETVARLPDRTVASAARVDLPTSIIGALPGPGPV